MGIDKKKINEKYGFTAWWNGHKELYESLKISKDVAKTIWAASADNFLKAIEDSI